MFSFEINIYINTLIRLKKKTNASFYRTTRIKIKKIIFFGRNKLRISIIQSNLTNRHLCTTATCFRPGKQKIHALTLVLKPFYNGTSLHRPLSSVPGGLLYLLLYKYLLNMSEQVGSVTCEKSSDFYGGIRFQSEFYDQMAT